MREEDEVIPGTRALEVIRELRAGPCTRCRPASGIGSSRASC